MEGETLSAIARARASASRRALQTLLGSSLIKNRLARHRASSTGLDPELAAMLRLDDLSHSSALSGRSVEFARRLTHEQILVVDAPAPEGVRARDLSFPGPSGSLAARLYEPEGVEPRSPAIAYIHGGGFVTCSIATHDALCRRLALGARARVISLDYRRAPEHRFPAAVEDAVAGLRWVLDDAEALGIDPERIAVAGDSAGGNLSLVTSLHTRRDARKPKLCVPLYPAADATCSLPSHERLGADYFLTRENIEWYYGHYVPERGSRAHPDVSPLLAEDVAGAPRTLLVVAAFDPLRDEGAAYAEKLSRAGVEVELEELPDMVHGYLMMTGASAAARAHTERLARRLGDELRR